MAVAKLRDRLGEDAGKLKLTDRPREPSAMGREAPLKFGLRYEARVATVRLGERAMQNIKVLLRLLCIEKPCRHLTG
ncbi:MAG: hypothetical protein KF689_11935 [Gemmatimonadaceae bacterium]|nr:hypothetical protein [Gemmatimonadaceae bacterium]